jgi:hypothetical protein
MRAELAFIQLRLGHMTVVSHDPTTLRRHVFSPLASSSLLFFSSLFIFFVSFVLGLWNRSLLASYALPYASTEPVIARAVTSIYNRLKVLTYKPTTKENLKIKKKVKGSSLDPYLSHYKVALYI